MKNIKRLICAVLCLAVFMTVSQPIGAIASEKKSKQTTSLSPEKTDKNTVKEEEKKVKKVKTEVSGVKHKYNLKQSQKLAMEITITPANPRRIVKLQRYNSEKKKYYTKKTYKTYKMKRAKLRVVIPKKFRKRTYSKWRIVVEESENAKRIISDPIRVYSSNVKTLELSSKAACIYCLDTDKVLYDKNMSKRLKPASCTKIMTLITAIESGRFGGTATATYGAINVPAQRLYARVGDRYRNRDLAFAMILGSANDASVMLANGTHGSVKNFVNHMNYIAKHKIKVKNSHFTNTYGLPHGNHYTTAYDLSRITAYGYQYSKFCEVVGREQYGFNSLRYRRHYACYTADHMVRDKVKGHIGGKTGFSEIKGASYTGLFKYKGRVYAVTIIHAKTKGIRWKDVRKLYRYIRKNGPDKY